MSVKRCMYLFHDMSTVSMIIHIIDIHEMSSLYRIHAIIDFDVRSAAKTIILVIRKRSSLSLNFMIGIELHDRLTLSRIIPVSDHHDSTTARAR